MNSKTPQMVVRVVGAITLLVGIIFWVSDNDSLIPWHILLGGIVTISLAILTYQAQRAGVSSWLVILAAVWTIGLPVYGLVQTRIFPEAYEWLAQVLHVLCALGAIGIAEMLSMQIRKKAV
jgi:hypothetical protein